MYILILGLDLAHVILAVGKYGLFLNHQFNIKFRLDFNYQSLFLEYEINLLINRVACKVSRFVLHRDATTH